MRRNSKAIRESVRRLLLDCTHTYQSTANNGIQRVLRNIANQAQTAAREAGVECFVVARRGTEFHRVPATSCPHSFRATAARVVQQVYRAVVGLLCRVLPVPILRRWLLPAPGHQGIFKYPLKLVRAVTKALFPRSSLVELAPGDVLMVMEPCGYYLHWQMIDAAQERGAKVGALVFDLIALTHPQFCDPAYVETYVPSLKESAARVEFFIAISRTVRDELAAHLQRAGLPRQWRENQLGHFPLGAELDLLERHGPVRAHVRQAFDCADGVPTYLFVATIEPRKNHTFLLDAFEQAWREGSPARLCLVGRTGWLYEQIVERIQQHPELGQRLFWLNDTNDTELHYCYEHARALVYPSHVEGFGLPLIEALSHRLLVLASDIPIHREVGQDYVTYFSLKNPANLARMVRILDHDPHSMRVKDPATYPVTDWRQSCQMFLDACIQLAEQSEPIPIDTARGASRAAA